MPKPNDPRRPQPPRQGGGDEGPISEERLAALLAQIPAIAEALRGASDREAMTAALAPITALSGTDQETVAVALGKLRDAPGAAAVDVVEAWSELGMQRGATKEARRSSIRLHTAGFRPTITIPAARSPLAAAPLPSDRIRSAEFAGAWGTRSRETSEIMLVMAWTRPGEVDSWQPYTFLVDFWRGGIKDFAVLDPTTPRKLEREVIEGFRRETGSEIVAMTLGQAKALFTEVMDQMTWHQAPYPADWEEIAPLVRSRIMREDIAADASATELLIRRDAEPDEVLVNFWSAWSFGDYALCYVLLSEHHTLRERVTRDEFIALRRQWYNEAHPARLRIGAVRPQTQEQSGLWVPNSALGSGIRANWSLFWSLEILETPIAGQLGEMPMATLTNPDNGRHWYWQSMTLERDPQTQRWRISRIRDEGATAQGRPVEDLLQRAETLWSEADNAAEQQVNRTDEEERDHVLHILSLAQEALSHYEVALTRLPTDQKLHDTVIEHTRQVAQWDRTATLQQRYITRFGETALARRDLSAFQFSYAQTLERQEDETGYSFWLDLAVQNAQRAVELDRSPESLVILAELLTTKEDDVAAEEMLRESLALRETVGAWADLGDLLMRKEASVEAVDAFAHAQRLDPATPQIRWRLGRALEMVHRVPEAKLVYEDALQQDPNDAISHALLGNLLFEAEELDEAADHFEQAIRLGMTSPQVYVQLAQIDAQRGRNARARQLLEQAAEMDPRIANELRRLDAQGRQEPDRGGRKPKR